MGKPTVLQRAKKASTNVSVDLNGQYYSVRKSGNFTTNSQVLTRRLFDGTYCIAQSIKDIIHAALIDANILTSDSSEHN